MGFTRTGGDDGQSISELPADDDAPTDLELSAADIDNPASSRGVVARNTPSSRGLANSLQVPAATAERGVGIGQEFGDPLCATWTG